MEGDRPHTISVAQYCYFNPLPPHGGRPKLSRNFFRFFAFQSTPSAWRETTILSMFRMFLIISIHSLRMEGDDFRVGEKDLELISIHSLRMEGDKEYDTYKVGTVAFQSTPSAWRETESPTGKE